MSRYNLRKKDIIQHPEAEEADEESSSSGESDDTVTAGPSNAPVQNSGKEECPYCKVWYTKANIKNHISTHEAYGSWKCPFSGTCAHHMFSNRTTLHNHWRRHHQHASAGYTQIALAVFTARATALNDQWWRDNPHGTIPDADSEDDDEDESVGSGEEGQEAATSPEEDDMEMDDRDESQSPQSQYAGEDEEDQGEDNESLSNSPSHPSEEDDSMDVDTSTSDDRARESGSSEGVSGSGDTHITTPSGGDQDDGDGSEDGSDDEHESHDEGNSDSQDDDGEGDEEEDEGKDEQEEDAEMGDASGKSGEVDVDEFDDDMESPKSDPYDDDDPNLAAIGDLLREDEKAFNRYLVGP